MHVGMHDVILICDVIIISDIIAIPVMLQVRAYVYPMHTYILWLRTRLVKINKIY